MSKLSERSSPLPPWLRIKLPSDESFGRTRGLIRRCSLHTVCSEAKCPNIFECWSKSTATFMILGKTCTRNCAFCNIDGGRPEDVDPDEPKRTAEAAAELGLKHVVVTSVTRDDLPDGGAAHFAAVVRALRERLPDSSVELLIPDFKGDAQALKTVLETVPDVLNHNVETVPRLYSRIRPEADFERSLELVGRAKAAGIRTKSGMMVGLGESDVEVEEVLHRLGEAGCDITTIGQYLRPSRRHPEPERFVHPDVFEEYAEKGRSLGMQVLSGPLVRSSYRAAECLPDAPGG